MKVNRIFSGIVLSLCLISCVVRVVNKIDLNNYLITEFEDESDYTEGKYEPFTYRNYGDYIEISGYYKPKTDFVIPAEIDGLPVTSIGKEAFRWSSLTSVKIPDSVTNIGEMAFYSCDGLTSIEIPDSVTTIGGSAFSNCRNLTSLKIPNSVTNIGSLAFSDCKSLKSVIIPNSVTSIGSMAFNDCESLKSAIIPNSITSIEDWTFSGCESLTSVEMSDSITYIGSDAFDKTLWLEKKREENPLVIVNNLLVDGQNCAGDVVIPDGVTSICDCSFSGSSLTSIEIPDSVTSIGNSAFSCCKKLKSVKIPDNVTIIDNSAFSSCDSLTSVEIPDSVTSIGVWAFFGCKALTSVEIPDSVTTIGDRAFGSTPWLESKQKENPLVIVNNLLIDGQTCSGNVIIPDGVTSIVGDAFWDCTGLKSIKIPDSVTSIGCQAFFGCTGLKSVEIPASVTSIEHMAFQNCKKLKKVTVLNPECDFNIAFSNGDKNYQYYFNGTIYGYENSTAQDVQKYGYKFESLGKAPERNTGEINKEGGID